MITPSIFVGWFSDIFAAIGGWIGDFISNLYMNPWYKFFIAVFAICVLISLLLPELGWRSVSSDSVKHKKGKAPKSKDE